MKLSLTANPKKLIDVTCCIRLPQILVKIQSFMS